MYIQMLKAWLQDVGTLLLLNVSHLFYNVVSIEYIMMDVILSSLIFNTLHQTAPFSI